MQAVDVGFAAGMFQHHIEVSMFADLLRRYGPRNILEIGTLNGGTALMFGEIASGKVITVDLPMGEFGGHSHNITYEAAEQRSQMLRSRNPKIHPVLGNSHDLVTEQAVQEILRGEQVDLLFIDGDHTYAGVRDDFVRYVKYVKPCGVVAFHDINPTAYHESVGCFVHKLWHELRTAYCHEEFSIGHDWGGIGVLFL